MESFLKEVMVSKHSERGHRYFVRFGKGEYGRRFLLKFNKGKSLKVKASFEMANDFVLFANALTSLRFSGKIFSKKQIAGMEGRKKGGVFAYEVSDISLASYPDAYFYLLDAASPGVSVKIKKALPKPGKDEEKIDDGFCTMDLDLKYWPQLKEAFFWDVPDCKKAEVEHTLKITDIVIPKDEKDPVKMREAAKRKGTVLRIIKADDKETTTEYPLEG